MRQTVKQKINKEKNERLNDICRNIDNTLGYGKSTEACTKKKTFFVLFFLKWKFDGVIDVMLYPLNDV